MAELPLLVAVGGAHVDRRGQVAGRYRPGASNPGTMREEVGGGAFNAARSAVQLGLAVALVSARGGDAAGAAVAEAIAEAGIADLCATFLDRATPTYTSLIDETGEQIAGLADMELYDAVLGRILVRRPVRRALAQAGAVLADANLPAAALASLAARAGEKPLFAIAVSPAKVVRLASLLPRLACLFMNRAEAAALSGADPQASPRNLARMLCAHGLARGVITGGPGAVTAFDAGQVFALTPPAPRAIADVTGAGDALAGATVAALVHGVEFQTALRQGVAAAVLAVESPCVVPDLKTGHLDHLAAAAAMENL